VAIAPHDIFKRLAAEIRDELNTLDWLYAEWSGVESGLGTNSLIMRGKASITHDFYCGVERIFKRIGNHINGGIPAGESWHQELLNDMKLGIPELRPPVITTDTYRLLLDFLSFRHKFRNIYGFELEHEKVADIEAKFPEAHKKFRADMEKFLLFLDTLTTPPSSEEG